MHVKTIICMSGVFGRMRKFRDRSCYMLWFLSEFSKETGSNLSNS